MRTRIFSLAAAAVLVATLAGCSASDTPEDAPAVETPAAAESTTSSTPEFSGTCEYTADTTGLIPREVSLPEAEPTVSGTVTATMTTSAGALTLELDADRTPCTVNSFASLATQKYFDDTPCHRLTTQSIFVLQCGDPSGTGTGGPGYAFADELAGTETYPAGTVAMANRGPGTSTNGSQFFLVFDESGLPAGYTVFGTLSGESLATLQAIGAQGTEDGAPDGAPKGGVTIEAIVIS